VEGSDLCLPQRETGLSIMEVVWRRPHVRAGTAVRAAVVGGTVPRVAVSRGVADAACGAPAQPRGALAHRAPAGRHEGS
jgi:hypothetical protein